MLDWTHKNAWELSSRHLFTTFGSREHGAFRAGGDLDLVFCLHDSHADEEGRRFLQELADRRVKRTLDDMFQASEDSDLFYQHEAFLPRYYRRKKDSSRAGGSLETLAFPDRTKLPDKELAWLFVYASTMLRDCWVVNEEQRATSDHFFWNTGKGGPGVGSRCGTPVHRHEAFRTRLVALHEQSYQAAMLRDLAAKLQEGLPTEPGRISVENCLSIVTQWAVFAGMAKDGTTVASKKKETGDEGKMQLHTSTVAHFFLCYLALRVKYDAHQACTKAEACAAWDEQRKGFSAEQQEKLFGSEVSPAMASLLLDGFSHTAAEVKALISGGGKIPVGRRKASCPGLHKLLLTSNEAILQESFFFMGYKPWGIFLLRHRRWH